MVVDSLLIVWERQFELILLRKLDKQFYFLPFAAMMLQSGLKQRAPDTVHGPTFSSGWEGIRLSQLVSRSI